MKAPTTLEQAKAARGRYGKVPGGGGFFYGQVIEVDGSGNYLRFKRGSRFRPFWVHRTDVYLHEDPCGSCVDGKTASGDACRECGGSGVREYRGPVEQA